MSIQPENVHKTLSKYMLVDGFDLVLDLKKSKGCRIYDSRNNRFFLDGFSFFASSPLGCNHPSLANPEFIKKIGEIAVNNPTNSDIYTQEMAEFVDTFSRLAVPDHFKHLFFISGGSLAVENGLKAAFDWKIRKNITLGNNEKGTKAIHFKDAFHGRTGYTIPMTNTFDLNKTKYFPIFKWPRIINPKITFPLNEKHLQHVMDLENQAVEEIEQAFSKHPDDIAALIIEPIQGEGGDNHFRREFFKQIQKLSDEHDAIFMVDEVQSGVGITGLMWAYEHFDVKPDILAFGKKTQVCGIMVSDKVDEVKDNVFSVSSRINSTWGGNLVDMVRAQKYFEVIKEERLVRNAKIQGKRLQEGLRSLQQKYPSILSNARGRGLMCAFDLPSPEKRNEMKNRLYASGLVVLGCGASTIRFRPPLIVSEEEIDEMIEIIDKTAQSF
ncbi:MAG: L-lysine 6-transaminase [Candidatus Thermoplasmatota archaeon]|nr:L-lysine 6-transaminase [Candidatus Thermoplasmatota archaeon]